MASKELKEELAEYAHNAWSGWMEYLFDKSQQNSDGSATIPAWGVFRWKRQMKTAYTELIKEEKVSDRDEADKIIEIIRKHIRLEEE